MSHRLYQKLHVQCQRKPGFSACKALCLLSTCLPHQTELHEDRDDVQEDALVSRVRCCYVLGAHSNWHTSGVDKQVLLKRQNYQLYRWPQSCHIPSTNDLLQLAAGYFQLCNSTQMSSPNPHSSETTQDKDTICHSPSFELSELHSTVLRGLAISFFVSEPFTQGSINWINFLQLGTALLTSIFPKPHTCRHYNNLLNESTHKRNPTGK